MSLAISGRIVPLTRQLSVAPSESATFKGSVWIDDDGRIAAVTKSRQKAPRGFEAAPVVDVGENLVLPGFVDLHSHLAYATLPLWVEEGRAAPFAHHDIWPSRPKYAEQITWPAYALLTASPREVLAYAEVRALIGGTTSIQGSPPSNKPLDGWLVRNVEDESLGGTLDNNRVLTSTLTLKDEQLGTRASRMSNGSTFIYHCAEGRRGSIVAREYEALRVTGCLKPQLVAIHTNALSNGAYGQWGEPGTIVWSPFSNLWLYGETTDVPEAIKRGIRVCVGSDWGPSGTRNVLAELKVAHLVAEERGWALSAFELVKMITANPGDVLADAWGHPVGRLEPGALADICVIAEGSHRADPFASVVHAGEAEVQLVLVGGRPLYGTAALMRRAGAVQTSELLVLGNKRQLALTRIDEPGQPWTFDEVLGAMERVRANPKKAIDTARARAYAGVARGAEPGLRLALDMPTGRVPVGGLPKDLGQIEVPALQPIFHDEAFFDSIVGRGFHRGLLDRLQEFYA